MSGGHSCLSVRPHIYAQWKSSLLRDHHAGTAPHEIHKPSVSKLLPGTSISTSADMSVLTVQSRVILLALLHSSCSEPIIVIVTVCPHYRQTHH